MRTYSPAIAYKCHNDCKQSGCPGHTTRIRFEHTSDIWVLEEDGKELHHFDPQQFRALLRSYLQSREAATGARVVTPIKLRFDQHFDVVTNRDGSVVAVRETMPPLVPLGRAAMPTRAEEQIQREREWAELMRPNT